MPNFSTLPSGPLELLAQACAPENEKRVVINSAVIKTARATRLAPHKLNPVSSPLETRLPSKPPGGTAPRISGKCHSDKSEGSASKSSAYPISVAISESVARLRNHRH